MHVCVLHIIKSNACELSIREIFSVLLKYALLLISKCHFRICVRARCLEISAQRAKAFAHSARSIAYLEGENSRMKQLVDHLR